jgi:3-methylcrotonyl-CoA carboxylase alpha subunit
MPDFVMTEKIVSIAGQQHELSVERDGSHVLVGEHDIEVLAARDREAEIRVDGCNYTVPFVIDGSQISFSFDGEIYFAEVADKGARGRSRHREQSMAAPMPGLVLKILVEMAAPVEKGAPLIILEAMKMEHQIHAPYAGTVRAINCREGELVQPGVDLVEIEKSE